MTTPRGVGVGVDAVRVALPDTVAQDEVRALVVELYPWLESSRYLAMFDNAGIDRRSLVQPLEWYASAHSLSERMHLACEHATALGAAAAREVLSASGVPLGAVDALVVASTTALRSPGIEVDLVARLGLRNDVRRVPLWGLASLGGVAGLGLAELLVRSGLHHVLVVATEANSLMFVPGDDSPEGLVTLALFSDGAGAAMVSANSGTALVGSASTLVADSVPTMGFDPTDEGMRWRLAPDVHEVAALHTRPSVDRALGAVGWSVDDLDHVLLHPGGVKVLAACASALDLPESALTRSYDALRRHGNISSATALSVLASFLDDGPPSGRALLTAMGPGFGFEHVLFEV